MTKEDIVRKLETELNKGITTEAQVVYLMTGLRKILEQQQAKKQYEYLTFHCDWVLHSKLQGTTAQKILQEFDAANIHLKNGIELRNLPPDLRKKSTVYPGWNGLKRNSQISLSQMDFRVLRLFVEMVGPTSFISMEKS